MYSAKISASGHEIGSGDPMVSVIVPAHNCAPYIGAALDSLLTQTVRDIEVIVIDDGSTDDTASIVSEYAERDLRVRFIRRQTPSGRPAVPRNEGLRAARGKYIAFLDADDVSLPTRFASAINAMDVSDATLAFADMLRFDGESGAADPQTRLQKAGFVARAARYLEPVTGTVYRCTPNFIGFMLAEMSAISTQTVIFARALLDDESLWFDESWVCAEDTDLFYRLAARARAVFLNETQTLYRVRRDSLTAAQPERTVLDGIAVRRINLERFRARLSQSEINGVRRTIASSLFELAYGRWCGGSRSEARAAYLESWRTVRSVAAAKGYFKAFVSRAFVIGAVRSVRETLRIG